MSWHAESYSCFSFPYLDVMKDGKGIEIKSEILEGCSYWIAGSILFIKGVGGRGPGSTLRFLNFQHDTLKYFIFWADFGADIGPKNLDFSAFS